MKTKLIKMLPAAVLAAVLAGCAGYPMGMSEEAWNRLTPEQKFQARLDEADRKERSLTQRHQARLDTIQREVAAIETVLGVTAEQTSLKAMGVSPATPAPVLAEAEMACDIAGGRAWFAGTWASFQPVSFTLAREQDRDVTLTAVDDAALHKVLIAGLSADGARLSICGTSDGGKMDCDVVADQTEAFLVLPEQIEAATLRCRSLQTN